MLRTIGLPAWIAVYIVCLPLAIFMGYLLATPTRFTSYAMVGIVMSVLVFPVFLRWNHTFLIVTWNAAVLAFFLPGQPNLGVVAAAGTLFIALLNKAMNKGGASFVHVRSVAYPLIFLLIVVLVTAKLTGGIGARVLGAESWGAKRYLGVIGGVIGYFAFVSRPVPRQYARILAYAFVLSGLTAIVSDLAYMAGPSFYFLFRLFPAGLALTQAVTQETIMRLSGVSFAAAAGFYFMLMRYGLWGIFEFVRPWRFAAFALLLGASLLGGYRSIIILAVMTLAVQFYFEGHFRSRLLPIFAVLFVLSAVFVVAFSDKLPLSVQRSLSFLPIKVDHTARHDAESTWDWRVKMWKTVLPEVPKYLFLGKGFSYSGTDYYLTNEAIRRGIIFDSWEDTLINGNYHHGILTLIIPFGIFGVIGFAWFCWGSIRVLYLNYKYGRQSLWMINTALLSYFVARLIFYVGLYGQFDLDLAIFTGTVGLSLSLNGGVCTREAPGTDEEEEAAGEEPVEREAEEEPEFALPQRAG